VLDDVAQPLGKVIRAARTRADLPAALVARRAQLDPAYFARIESGQSPDPPFSTVVKIAKVLGLTLDELAGYAPAEESARSRAAKELRVAKAVEATLNDLHRASDRLEKLLEP
jgi:transcriptional regulator with XRE-family HTH domain